MAKLSTHACVEKMLADLRGFNVEVQIDNETYEVLLVKYKNNPSVAKVHFQS